jgi:hypothetical protein
MSIQAAQFAATFERLGRRMLAQLESLPEGLWDRAPLIHFLPDKKSVRGPVWVSPSPMASLRTTRARSPSKIAPVLEPAS